MMTMIKFAIILMELCGPLRVRIVDRGPADVRVKIVEHGQVDARIRWTSRNPVRSGEWMEVQSGEDVRIRIVQSGEDIRIREVQSNSGGCTLRCGSLPIIKFREPQ